MDVLGYKIAKIFNVSNSFRSVFWIIGSSFFVFIWFLLHFFISFHPSYIWISLVSILVIFTAIKKEYSLGSIFKNYKEILLLLLLLIPFAKTVFYKTSLPPREWDEMAYHFYSPQKLNSELVWNFQSPIYAGELDWFLMLPRTIETTFVIVFSITKTYATAKLLNTLIYLSMIVAVSSFLRKQNGMLSVLIFQLVTLHFSPDILYAANTGYIDTATASFGLISLIGLFKLIKKPDLKNFKIAVLFSAIALGTKYSIIAFILASWIISLLIIHFENKHFLKRIAKFINKYPKIAFFRFGLITALIIAGGGYWYLKNLILAGNPIFPFSFFPCSVCHEYSINPILLGWGYLDFNLKNFPEILEQTFDQDWLKFIIFFTSALYVFMNKNNYLKKLILLIIGGYILEYLLLGKIANYNYRFFTYWPIIISIALALPYDKSISLKSKKYAYISLAILTTVIFYHSASKQTIANDHIMIDDKDRFFANRETNLSRWLQIQIPTMYEFVNECGMAGDLKTFQTFDPNIRMGKDGLAKIFLVNCKFEFPQLGGTVEETFVQLDNTLPLFSTEECSPDKTNPYDYEPETQYYELNQLIVCDREESEKFVYTKKVN